MVAKRILVIDDEKPLNQALSIKLSNAGFEVDSAFDGVAGLDLFKQKKYDLALLDMIMPKLDGFKVLETIRKTNKEIKIIILSNLGQPEDESRAKELGANDFFIKSNMSLSEILHHVDKLLA